MAVNSKQYLEKDDCYVCPEGKFIPKCPHNRDCVKLIEDLDSGKAELLTIHMSRKARNRVRAVICACLVLTVGVLSTILWVEYKVELFNGLSNLYTNVSYIYDSYTINIIQRKV